MASEETTSGAAPQETAPDGAPQPAAEPQTGAPDPDRNTAEAQGEASPDETSPEESEAAPEESESQSESQAQGGKQKQRIFTVYNIIGIILCVLLLPGFIISTTLLFSSWIHSDVPPSCFGYTPLMVQTGSMSPVFDEDDLVLIRNTQDDATYQAGDIICFHSGSTYVTHRIKEVTQDENGVTVYITQGDANNAPDDGSVRAEQILGVYKTRLKGMGKVFLFVQTPVGMMVCVMLPIILVLLLFLVPPLLAARGGATAEAENGTESGENNENDTENGESGENGTENTENGESGENNENDTENTENGETETAEPEPAETPEQSEKGDAGNGETGETTSS